MNIDKYIIPHQKLDAKKITGPWEWLIDGNKEILLITKMGDLLLKDSEDALHFLCTSLGTIEHVTNYSNDFFNNKLSAEQYFELFLPTMIEDLEENGKILKENQVYAYTKFLLMGGKNDWSNIYCSDVYAHFSLTADFHFQIKDLPDGTPITLKAQ